MVAVFTFTLGVHLGKRAGGNTRGRVTASSPLLETVDDIVPNRDEAADNAKEAKQVIEDSLNQQLHDEVTRTGIRLHTPHQVELPEKPKTKNAGATHIEAPVQKHK